MPRKSRTQNLSRRPTPPEGKLPTPHGSTPWHFRMASIEGNGFNGVIRHMWRTPVESMAIPGVGLVRNAPR